MLNNNTLSKQRRLVVIRRSRSKNLQAKGMNALTDPKFAKPISKGITRNMFKRQNQKENV